MRHPRPLPLQPAGGRTLRGVAGRQPDSPVVGQFDVQNRFGDGELAVAGGNLKHIGTCLESCDALLRQYVIREPVPDGMAHALSQQTGRHAVERHLLVDRPV